jgi:opine dehydrogenase
VDADDPQGHDSDERKHLRGNEVNHVTPNRITVLGGGNTAFSIAANLALAGNEILIWEHPDFAHTLDPIRETMTIQLDGAARTGAARIAAVTTDPAEALAWSETLVCSVPSYAHQPFVEQLLPHLKPGHLLALLPGNLGALAVAAALREAGVEGVIVAESDTAPYVCRKSAPDRAVIWGSVTGLGIGVEPASQTDEAMPVLRALFPGAVAYQSALHAGLSALNPVVHPPGVLMNAGRIERSRGEFWFYEEGVTPSVVRAIEGVDRERLALGVALGLTLTPVAEAFHQAGFGPKGDIWATINGSRMLTALRAPGQVDTRWLTEDIPYGLASWARLGYRIGVETPVMDALVVLASVTLGRDFGSETRGLDVLGLGDVDDARLRATALGFAG